MVSVGWQVVDIRWTSSDATCPFGCSSERMVLLASFEHQLLATPYSNPMAILVAFQSQAGGALMSSEGRATMVLEPFAEHYRVSLATFANLIATSWHSATRTVALTSDTRAAATTNPALTTTTTTTTTWPRRFVGAPHGPRRVRMGSSHASGRRRAARASL